MRCARSATALATQTSHFKALIVHLSFVLQINLYCPFGLKYGHELCKICSFSSYAFLQRDKDLSHSAAQLLEACKN